MSYPIASLLLNLILGLVYPAVFIWAVNTLFRLGIPLTFKTWLASLLLFLAVRFFVSKASYPPTYDDEYGTEEDEDDYDEDDEDEDEEEDDDDDNDEPTPYIPRRRRFRRVK